MIKNVWQRRLLLILCIILAIEFIPGGAFKFVSGETFFGPPYSVKFVNWGYPAWFRFVVGAGEIFGAVLLLLPRTALSVLRCRVAFCYFDRRSYHPFCKCQFRW